MLRTSWVQGLPMLHSLHPQSLRLGRWMDRIKDLPRPLSRCPSNFAARGLINTIRCVLQRLLSSFGWKALTLAGRPWLQRRQALGATKWQLHPCPHRCSEENKFMQNATVYPALCNYAKPAHRWCLGWGAEGMIRRLPLRSLRKPEQVGRPNCTCP